MIRRIHLYLVASVLIISACNQSSKETENWKSVYKNAYSNGDYLTGVVALNHLLVLDSANKKEYIDSLALYYTKKLKNYKAGKIFVDKGLEINPDNISLMEFKSIFLGAEDKVQESKALMEKAYKLSGQNKHLYLIAAMKLAMDNDVNAYIQSVNGILYGKYKPETIDVNIDENTSQNVDLKAYCYVEKAKMSSTPQEAVSYLDSALMITPNFQEAIFYKNKFTEKPAAK
jgi:tetratricopeptide (TPR) repeat protein